MIRFGIYLNNITCQDLNQNNNWDVQNNILDNINWRFLNKQLRNIVT